MKQKCQACGVEKDTEVKELYPYPDDGNFDDVPIDPLLTIDCQASPYIRVEADDWRVVTVCHACFHRLDPDMWIGRDGWGSLNPVIPFEQLPKLQTG